LFKQRFAPQWLRTPYCVDLTFLDVSGNTTTAATLEGLLDRHLKGVRTLVASGCEGFEENRMNKFKGRSGVLVCDAEKSD
jgi:hypothetical protein